MRYFRPGAMICCSLRFLGRPDQIAAAGDWVFADPRRRGAGKNARPPKRCRMDQDFPDRQSDGPTSDCTRDVMCSRIRLVACCPRSERRIRAPRAPLMANGATSNCSRPKRPTGLRGKQAYELWCDDWRPGATPDAFEQALLGLLLGDSPQVVINPTPRPIKIIKQLLGTKTRS